MAFLLITIASVCFMLSVGMLDFGYFIFSFIALLGSLYFGLLATSVIVEQLEEDIKKDPGKVKGSLGKARLWLLILSIISLSLVFIKENVVSFFVSANLWIGTLVIHTAIVWSSVNDRPRH